MLGGDATAWLVTTSKSERQQRNRAFAAELLAPSALLRERITHATVADNEVDALAQEFHVSSLVIEHQIENHELARLLPWR